MIHDVRLQPFFIGKYEVTQGQWLRVMGVNPSVYNPTFDKLFTLAHPVENVDWNQSAAFVRRLNFILPSETEWEYACRAGSITAFAYGEEPGVLEGRANVGDQTLESTEPSRAVVIERAKWEDGYAYHAPVNRFAANAFGLYGIHGNVGEWCRDWWHPTALVDVPLDGGSPDPERKHRMWRDGTWLGAPSMARAAARHGHPSTLRSPTNGLRVARVLELTPP
jgi:formylglycine-generating enzyme required for sulfatase activity